MRPRSEIDAMQEREELIKKYREMQLALFELRKNYEVLAQAYHTVAASFDETRIHPHDKCASFMSCDSVVCRGFAENLRLSDV